MSATIQQSAIWYPFAPNFESSFGLPAQNYNVARHVARPLQETDSVRCHTLERGVGIGMLCWLFRAIEWDLALFLHASQSQATTTKGGAAIYLVAS